GSRPIVHVDCEPGETNNRVKGCEAIIAELPSFLTAVSSRVPAAFADAQRFASWREDIAELKHAWPDVSELSGTPGINPNVLMHQISACTTDAAAYVADVGQHQMWAAQSLDLLSGQRFLTSGGMGA